VAKPWSKVRERIERELVAAGVGTARTGVEHIDHHRRVQPRLDTHGDRLARRDEAGRRQQVVDEFHRLARARLVAQIEGLTDDFVQRRKQLEVGACVERDNSVAGFREASGDGKTHVAQADKPDVHDG